MSKLERQQEGIERENRKRQKEQEILLHEAAVTWQTFGTGANKKVLQSVRMVL